MAFRTLYHIIYNLFSFCKSVQDCIWVWKLSYLMVLRGDINTSVYNNHMVIQYDKYNKIGQYGLFSVIKYNKDTNKN